MKIFSADAETDGLYGRVWAIGAILVDPEDPRYKYHPTSRIDLSHSFVGQLDPSVVTDPWVIENVVPHVDLPRYDTREELLEGFWQFWLEFGRDEGTVAVADCGHPVESGLFRACVELDLKARCFQGPFPLDELSTLLRARGLDPKLDRRELIGRPDLVAHDPFADAIVAALCWAQVF